MKKIIDIDTHAFFRMMERGLEFGIDYHETKERVFTTVRNGTKARRKHISRNGVTYYFYFKDNLAFYVLCREKSFEGYVKCLIKTVIIEKGRE